METIKPNGNITLDELQYRVKYILAFKPKLEGLLDNDLQKAVSVAKSVHKFINDEDRELSKEIYNELMLNNKYLSNYRSFIREFRQFNGRISESNLHSFIHEITSAHESSTMVVLFPNGGVPQFKDL